MNMVIGKFDRIPAFRAMPQGGLVLSAFISVTLGDKTNASIQIVAENEVAEEIQASYTKGETIHFLGEFAKFVSNYGGNYITTIGYKVLKIDYTGEIAKEVNTAILQLFAIKVDWYEERGCLSFRLSILELLLFKYCMTLLGASVDRLCRHRVFAHVPLYFRYSTV